MKPKRLFTWAASVAFAFSLNTGAVSAQGVIYRSDCEDVTFNISKRVDMYERTDILYEWRLNNATFNSAEVREIYFLDGQRVGVFISSYEEGDDVAFTFVYPLLDRSPREVFADIHPPQSADPEELYTSLLFAIDDQAGSYSFRCISDTFQYENLETTRLFYNPVWLTTISRGN